MITENPLAVKKTISFVPDSPEVYEKLTGIEYLNFRNDVYAVPAEVRAAGIVALVLFSLAPVFLLYLRLLHGAYQVTAELGQPEVVLAAGFMISAFAVRALSTAGMAKITWFVYYLFMNLVGAALVFLAGQKLFYRGLIGGSEISRGKTLSKDVIAQKLSSSSSLAAAIATREIKHLLRTPIYLFNSLAVLVIVPVILVIPYVPFND